MMPGLSRAVLALAVRCLGDRRREWALAMEAEFEAATEDGTALAFASGCLLTALRELPAHEEGRFAIAAHGLAFVLLIPTAALLAASILADFPYSYLPVADGQRPILSNGNLSAVPPLAILVALLAASHLRMAWLVLERDWERATAMAAMIAAATVTLTIFSFVVFDYSASAFSQAAVLTVELAAIAALARWHARSFETPSEKLV